MSRSAKPQLLEAQKCAQPISFHIQNASIDSSDLVIDLIIENKFLFTAIEKHNFTIFYQVFQQSFFFPLFRFVLFWDGGTRVSGRDLSAACRAAARILTGASRCP